MADATFIIDKFVQDHVQDFCNVEGTNWGNGCIAEAGYVAWEGGHDGCDGGPYVS